MKAIQLVPAMEEGGVERYTVLLNRILTEGGWENLVISAGGKLAAEIERDGGRQRVLDLKSKNPLTYFLRAAKLRRILIDEKPDVVCAHSRVPAWLLVWASRGLPVRWMTYAHGANSISRYSRVMVRGELTMCPSTFIADYLTSAYGISAERLRIVPHAVDSTRFNPQRVDRAVVERFQADWKIGPDQFVVMAIGRITRLKGYDALIRAMARVKCPECKLVIVGGAESSKESYLQELKALVKTLGLEASVVFAGGQSQIPECLAVADVLVSANTQKPEAFGLSMAEALMMGKPVIAKAFGGALDIVRDGRDGILVPVEDTEEPSVAFAEAIDRIREMTFGDLRQEARRRFDLDVMTQKTRAVYGEFLK